MTILLSGATGFLGAALVRRCGEPVVALLRGRDWEDRARLLTRRLGAEVRGVRGDVRAPRWGLGPDELDGLRGNVRVVVHAAANTRWADPWEELEATNVRGAEGAVEVAALVGAPLVHLSSLYAAYHKSADVPEALVDEQPWLSHYERSKCRAEWRVRDRAREAGVTAWALRVGSLVGDVEPFPDERPAAVQVPFIRLLGLLAGTRACVVPHARDAVIDVVPRDVTADVVLALSRTAPEDGFAVRNLGAGGWAPTVASVLAALAAERARRGEPSFRPVAVPRAWLLEASSVGERLARSPRALPFVALRYLASSARYLGDSVPQSALSPAALALAMGLTVPSAVPAGAAFYEGWLG